MTKKAYAKVNIFLKITGFKAGYHTLLSRFAKVENLYDTISFIPTECDHFIIDGCDGIEIEDNTIYRAYRELINYSGYKGDFFKNHKVVVQKNIPQGAGLGGGSSDCASFMHLFNEVCNLGLDISTLAKIGSKIGADIPFFIYNYNSANVRGFGEIVEQFEEAPLNIEVYTPNIYCSTPLVYRTFREKLLDKIDLDSFQGWETLGSKEILSTIDPISANDLFKASLILYPELKDEVRDGWYFSGSGSSFFRIK